MKVNRYVYFVRPVGMDGPIKIGTSRKPDTRLLELAVWSPWPLEMIGAAPGNAAAESLLHRCFSEQHSHREWFRTSPLLLRIIDRILSGETVEAACKDILPGPPPVKKKWPVNRPIPRRIRKFQTAANSRAAFRIDLRSET